MELLKELLYIFFKLPWELSRVIKEMTMVQRRRRGRPIPKRKPKREKKKKRPS